MDFFTHKVQASPQPVLLLSNCETGGSDEISDSLHGYASVRVFHRQQGESASASIWLCAEIDYGRCICDGACHGNEDGNQ